MEKQERRNYTGALEIRKTDNGEESRTIEGYAMVFDSESLDLGGFREKIAPGALDGVLERSDVLALLNHDPQRGVLARSRRGEGSLTLEVDDKGLRYSFTAPKTALGDEVLEGVRRRDIGGSSFAFTVARDRWEKEEDGRYLRTIEAFGELYDVSPVVHPAYEATSVDTRSFEKFKAELREKEQEEDKKEEEPQEEGRADDPEEQEKEQCAEDSEETKEPEEDTDKTENERNDKTTGKKMEKRKFSLLNAINALVENKAFDEATEEVVAMGRRAAKEASVPVGGRLVLPVEVNADKRYQSSPEGIIASQNTEAETYGGEAVPTDLLDILGPLRDRMVVSQLGARMLNLRGNVEIPVYDGASCTWEEETGKAKNGAGKFSKIKLTPKRLTAKIPISKQFLIQASESAESLIRQDLINCIADKLQATMFGKGAGSDTEPAGLFKGVTAESAEFTYADAIALEKELETAKVFGEKNYVLSPDAKAILRTTKVDAGSGRFVMENGEVCGVPAVSTGSVTEKGLILGDWSNLYVATFGALDLTVDPYTLADSAQVLLVVNAWFDYAAVRPKAFVKKILK